MTIEEALKEARKTKIPMDGRRARKGEFAKILPVILELRDKGLSMTEIHKWLAERGLYPGTASGLASSFYWHKGINGLKS